MPSPVQLKPPLHPHLPSCHGTTQPPDLPRCCPALPMWLQMEGANLYDVFQKISKGVYEPPPAEQFSPTLRSLVVRMLTMDPAGEPGGCACLRSGSPQWWPRALMQWLFTMVATHSHAVAPHNGGHALLCSGSPQWWPRTLMQWLFTMVATHSRSGFTQCTASWDSWPRRHNIGGGAALWVSWDLTWRATSRAAGVQFTLWTNPSK